MSEQWKVVVVGSMALDNIETPYGKEERVLGGAAVYASCAARRFAPTAPIGVVGEDFAEEHISFLESLEIVLDGVQRRDGKTFHWSGSYIGAMGEAKTLDTRLGVFESFSPIIPDSLRSAKCVLLANIHPALQLQVLDQMQDPEVVAADTMNFWIDGENDLLRQVISRVRVMFINEGEIRSLTGNSNLVAAAEALLSMGPEIVVLKRGEHGATIHHRDGEIAFVPAYPSRLVCDPTGAGDSLAGGTLGYIAAKGECSLETLRRGVIRGTVLASCAIEGFGPFRLASTEESEIEQRISRLQRMLGLERLSQIGSMP